ncbi:hypothetical protein [Maridesulfovibrio bastinii]|uniref:hypothetical protein n=1 Tax=Maridesulfovibrio bastinii TaxID=47157 RepID=UPI00040C8C2B|nr:hypothetical protein [Maridesulfovibrio bastinii]
MEIRGPFYNQKEAARYCGYSASAFADKLRSYDLPRLGPNRNRYARSVLDLWMTDPDQFLPKPIKKSRKPFQVHV